jgi:hypothetical protein
MSDWDLEDVAALMKNDQKDQWDSYYGGKKGYDVWDWGFGIFKNIFTIPIYLFVIITLFGLLGK